MNSNRIYLFKILNVEFLVESYLNLCFSVAFNSYSICRPRLPIVLLSKQKYTASNEPNANVECSLFTDSHLIFSWFTFFQLLIFGSSRIQSNKINDSLSNFAMNIFDNEKKLRAPVILSFWEKIHRIRLHFIHFALCTVHVPILDFGKWRGKKRNDKKSLFESHNIWYGFLSD